MAEGQLVAHERDGRTQLASDLRKMGVQQCEITAQDQQQWREIEEAKIIKKADLRDSKCLYLSKNHFINSKILHLRNGSNQSGNSTHRISFNNHIDNKTSTNLDKIQTLQNSGPRTSQMYGHPNPDSQSSLDQEENADYNDYYEPEYDNFLQDTYENQPTEYEENINFREDPPEAVET
uniref:Uncharacterized protein LOC114337638 n=1 Tax=Diabrotica virgifera virgifera TaxID=50390 RepID=A0A6P7GAZ0_DIAVI